MDIKILLVGCGNVGKSFIKLLSNIDSGNTFNIGFVGIVDKKLGSFISSKPISPKEISRFFSNEYTFEEFKPDSGTILRDLTLDSILEEVDFNVMIEATSTNYENGEPSITYVKKAFSRSAHVITANKGPVGFAYNLLKDMARENGVSFRFEATVMSGTPLFSFVRNNLKGIKINRIRGVLNGTSNFIFSKMEDEGLEFENALKLAMEKGYTEKDFNVDIKGIDAKLKTVILANVLMGGWLKISDLPDVDLNGILLEKVKRGLEEGKKYKLISEIRREGDSIVGDLYLELVGSEDPLYSVNLNYNKVVLYTDILGKVSLAGPGSGPDETAYGLFLDLYELIKELGYNK